MKNDDVDYEAALEGPIYAIASASSNIEWIAERIQHSHPTESATLALLVRGLKGAVHIAEETKPKLAPGANQWPGSPSIRWRKPPTRSWRPDS
ncbi:hypothetical protein BB934_45355 (plasmid) [Microvirga ossetica]|uniref:Uncharacterized protein n=1 Tax=Microvirga ossetica TaxID=1882682 RepID=A0A1B2EZM7_9HYPH|nr:hypothetical protein BB934_45355 [Microvirga ossetica]